MTNNQLCNVIGIIGCVITFFGLGFMFFGVTAAWMGAAAGLALCGLSLIGYE